MSHSKIGGGRSTFLRLDRCTLPEPLSIAFQTYLTHHIYPNIIVFQV